MGRDDCPEQDASISKDCSLTVIPEPSALALLGVGGIVLFAYAWRKRRQTA